MRITARANRIRSTVPFGNTLCGIAAETSRHGTRLPSGRCRLRGRRRLWHRKRGARLIRRRSSRRARARVLPEAIRTLLQQNKPEKSDLRNHQAIVQPRLYDCLMVTQITLNTEPHGFDPCQGHSYEKADMGYPGLIRSPWPGVVGAGLLLS